MLGRSLKLSAVSSLLLVCANWINLDDVSERESVVRAIDLHQNPADCSNKKFLFHQSHPHGHGSCVHISTYSLGVAMSYDRILLYDQSWYWADRKKCPGNSISPDCYFLPLSRCQKDINYTEAMLSVPVPIPGVHINKPDDPTVRDPKLKEEYFIDNKDAKFLSGDFKHFWWWYPTDKAWTMEENRLWQMRATNYLTRPKKSFLQDCKKFLETYLVVLLPNASAPVSTFGLYSSPPTGSITMHVRHGDKHYESTLFDLDSYMDKAVELVNNHICTPYIILGTDDSEVIKKIQENVTARRGFTFFYTNSTRENRSDRSSLFFAGEIGIYEFTVDVMANVYMSSHPHVNGLVLTLNSNFDTMIHELRQAHGTHNLRVIDISHNPAGYA